LIETGHPRPVKKSKTGHPCPLPPDNGDITPYTPPENRSNEQTQGGLSQKNTKPKNRTRDARKALDDGFKSWYDAYPRKKQPKDARKAFDKAIRERVKTKNITADEAIAWLIDVTRQFAASPEGQKRPDGDFRKYPASWLNVGGHLEDPAEWNSSQNGNDAYCETKPLTPPAESIPA
jgi:hypothetical protein